MRVIRLDALIATAQVALVVILFAFGYSVAHATTIFSGAGTDSQHMQHTLDTSDTSRVMQALGTGLSNTGGTIIVHFKGDAAATSAQTLLVIGHWASQAAFVADGSQFGSPSITTDQVISPAQNAISTGADFTQTFTYTVAFNPSLFYAVEIIGDNNANYGATLYGSTAAPIAGLPRAMNALCANFGMSCPKNYPLQQIYIDFTDSGGYTPPVVPPPANGLAFIAHLPTSTTVASTSVEFNATYYVASTTIEAQAGHGGFGLSSTKYYLNLTRLDVASSSVWFIANGAGNDQWNTLDKTIVLAASSTWRGVWTSYDASSTYPTYQRSNYFNFSVMSDALLSGLGLAGLDQIPSLSSASTTAIAPAPCGITNVSGCFQNAIVYLFYPSTASLDQFGTLWTLVKNKPPFGYIVAVQTAVGTLSASSTATFNLGTVPFMTAIFDPFRTAVAVLMWLVFIVAFYHRLSTLDI